MATRKSSSPAAADRPKAGPSSEKPSEGLTKKVGRAVASAGRRVTSPGGSASGTPAKAAAATVAGEGGARATITRAPGEDNRGASTGPDRPPMPRPEGGSTLALSGRLAAKSAGRVAQLADKLDGQASLARELPFNAGKADEYGEAARDPQPGRHAAPADDAVTGSTLTETARSEKVGDGSPAVGENADTGNLDRYRADAGGQALTTNQGVQIADNQHSLKAGLRGPTLLEDFILREKISHFDHERISERVVHARGSAAHGYFECYAPLTELTRASLFAEADKRTPVFVRFSTVAGERGSADTVRDVRGFAVKFYTDEGNWDLVGNNIPVFFIQDAMKFPDLIHAAKPEPQHQIPQASTAHDTFSDFVSMSSESAHMLMWAMSDRGIPRSYRTMQGFGVHTFRFVDADGDSRFVKFHWNPVAGTHSLVWDEAATLAGGCPFQAGRAGFVPARARSATAAALEARSGEDRLRGKPERFAKHYAQARLFFHSQTKVEQDHIAAAFRFELSRVSTPTVRERVLALLVNVDARLAQRVADGLGMDLPEPLPRAGDAPTPPEVERSPSLSLFARPGDGSIRGRKIALLVADGVEVAPIAELRDALLAAGAIPPIVGGRFGRVSSGVAALVVDATMEAMPAELFDALVVPDGERGVAALAKLGPSRDYVRSQYRHAKTILVLGAGALLLEAAGVPMTLEDGGADPGLIVADGGALGDTIERFATAIARHRHFERETDPPRV